jgi:hypothetical protein
MNLRLPEFKIVDLLVPWSAVLAIIGFVLSWLIMIVLERSGLTRFIWHLPLFFLGMVVLITSLLGAFFLP